MKSNQKQNISIILGILCLLSPFFSYWQFAGSINSPSIYSTDNKDCTVCGNSPLELEQFIEMTNSILSTLSTRYATQIRAWNYRIYGPWQGGLYGSIINNTSSSPNIYKNIVGGTLRNLDQKQSMLRTTSELLGIYGKDMITDGSLGIVAVSQPRPIVRDYQKLLDIDSMIGDKVFEVGIAWGFYRTLSKDTINEIQSILENHTGEWKLFKQVKLNPKTTTSNILKAMMALNHKYKNGINPPNKAVAIKE